MKLLLSNLTKKSLSNLVQKEMALKLMKLNIMKHIYV